MAPEYVLYIIKLLTIAKDFLSKDMMNVEKMLLAKGDVIKMTEENIILNTQIILMRYTVLVEIGLLVYIYQEVIEFLSYGN